MFMCQWILLRGPGRGVASAGFDEQANLTHGVLLVIGEVGEDFHLAAIELVWASGTARRYPAPGANCELAWEWGAGRC